MSEVPKIEELKDFTLKGYVKLLQYLSQTYKIVTFREIPRKDIPYLILRHDVDISLSAALRMARIERDLGIKSTYFVLFTDSLYNPLEGNNVSVLKQISQIGHEIGFHYCPADYRLYSENPKRILKIEIQLLEQILGKKIHAISRHGPWDKDPFATMKEYANANHPSLRGDLLVHDSNRAWTPLQGLHRLLNDPPRRVQILTHPYWWQEDKLSREATLERLFQSREKENLRMKKKLKEIWMADPAVAEFDTFAEKGGFTQLHNQENVPSKIVKKRGLRIFHHYDEIFRWYMLNTMLGWNVHRLADIIRNKFGH